MMDGLNGIGDKMVKRFFRRVDDCVWDLMTGKVGVQTPDGIKTLEGEGENAQVVVNMFDQFGVPLPAFAQNTPVSDIKNGDLIYNDKRVMGWVIKCPSKGNVSFKLLKPDGTRGEWRPPKVQSLGLDLNGAMVLRSLVNMMPGTNLGAMQGMLMPLLLAGGGSEDMEQMLPILLMTQMGLGGMDKSGGGNLLQTMMLMKLVGGKGLGGIFGGGNKTAGAGTGRKAGGFFDNGDEGR